MSNFSEENPWKFELVKKVLVRITNEYDCGHLRTQCKARNLIKEEFAEKLKSLRDSHDHNETLLGRLTSGGWLTLSPFLAILKEYSSLDLNFFYGDLRRAVLNGIDELEICDQVPPDILKELIGSEGATRSKTDIQPQAAGPRADRPPRSVTEPVHHDSGSTEYHVMKQDIKKAMADIHYLFTLLQPEEVSTSWTMLSRIVMHVDSLYGPSEDSEVYPADSCSDMKDTQSLLFVAFTRVHGLTGYIESKYRSSFYKDVSNLQSTLLSAVGRRLTEYTEPRGSSSVQPNSGFSSNAKHVPAPRHDEYNKPAEHKNESSFQGLKASPNDQQQDATPPLGSQTTRSAQNMWLAHNIQSNTANSATTDFHRQHLTPSVSPDIPGDGDCTPRHPETQESEATLGVSMAGLALSSGNPPVVVHGSKEFPQRQSVQPEMGNGVLYRHQAAAERRRGVQSTVSPVSRPNLSVPETSPVRGPGTHSSASWNNVKKNSDAASMEPPVTLHVPYPENSRPKPRVTVVRNSKTLLISKRPIKGVDWYSSPEYCRVEIQSVRILKILCEEGLEIDGTLVQVMWSSVEKVRSLILTRCPSTIPREDLTDLIERNELGTVLIGPYEEVDGETGYYTQRCLVQVVSSRRTGVPRLRADDKHSGAELGVTWPDDLHDFCQECQSIVDSSVNHQCYTDSAVG